MEKNQNLRTFCIFFGIILFYIIIKANSLNYSYSDENTYFYMGKLIAEGLVPYKDFFFSHPPLQVYIFALLFNIFGFNFLIFKLTPLIFTIISALFIYSIANQKLGIKEAILSLVLFLFSYDSLRFSSYAIGVNLTTMFMIIGIYFFLNKKYFLSGIFYGIAAVTGLYSLVFPLVILFFLFLKMRKDFPKFLAGFCIVFILINLVFIALAGRDYIISVYKYHLLKPSEESNKFQVLGRLVKVNLLLFVSFFVYIFRRIFFRYKKLDLIFLLVLIYLFFLISLQSIFGFYSMLIFPFLAILGSSSLGWLTKKNKIIFFIIILLIILSPVWSINKFIKYDFQDFKNANEIANFIKSNSIATNTIYGDDSITTLLALLSNRRVTANFADSNNFIFRSGIISLSETIQTLRSEKVKFIIIYKLKTPTHTGRFGPAFIDEFYEFVTKECSVAKEFKEDWQGYEKVVEVYGCEF